MPKRYSVSGRSINQKTYIRTVEHNDITFCVGPAGTGKTHIATALAVVGILKEKFDRIIITRPLVQAGEDTGYLPGDINEKLKPFLRPIYDEMKLYISYSDIQGMLNSMKIEVVPFAYMRGRNFKQSFIIADECQNATDTQLKMLLTRLGEGSKMVLTGDTSQSDLAHNQRGGFEHYLELFEELEGVGVVRLDKSDIVRHPVVARIIEAMEKYHARTSQKSVGS
jgi:phosphate starvation-inducible PhoH-like protein